MSENKSDTDTSMLAAAQAALVAHAAAAAADSSAAAHSSVRDSPNRKKPKVANPVVHISQFLASVNALHGPQPHVRSDAYHSARVSRWEELIRVFLVFACDDFNLCTPKHSIMFPLFPVEVH